MADVVTLPATIRPRLLTREQVAEWLGVSPGTVDAMTERKQLPEPLRFGSKLRRWDIVALDQWIDTLSGFEDASLSEAERRAKQFHAEKKARKSA